MNIANPFKISKWATRMNHIPPLMNPLSIFSNAQEKLSKLDFKNIKQFLAFSHESLIFLFLRFHIVSWNSKLCYACSTGYRFSLVFDLSTFHNWRTCSWRTSATTISLNFHIQLKYVKLSIRCIFLWEHLNSLYGVIPFRKQTLILITCIKNKKKNFYKKP